VAELSSRIGHGAEQPEGLAPPESLSNASRLLTRLVAILWALIGVVFFVAPSWSQERFPWKVSDFVTMTIGGWCLGTAFLAWWAARVWTWGAARPSLVYLWTFGALELGVALWFGDLLRTDEVLTWPYLATIGATVVAGAVGVVDLVRLRPTATTSGPPVPPWARAATILFVVLVGFLGLVAAAAPDSGLNGRVFPEPLSRFTLRAFGAFYFALALGAIPTTVAKTLTPVTNFISSAMALVVLILFAALVYIGTFEMSDHPLQVLYLAAYLAVGIGSTILLVLERSRSVADAPG
jgi:hypothetical protein